MLDSLAVKYDTDKQMGKHNYTLVYERYFEHMRNSVENLLEIGVNTGASHYMWQDYFPNAIIWGMDINDCSHAIRERIKILKADQNNHAELDAALEILKDVKFDIIIDDGGHFVSNHLNTFPKFWELVKPGGLYIIEDLATVYSPEWADCGEETTTKFLYRIIDKLHQDPDSLDIFSVAFFNELAFIEKSATARI